MNRYELMKALYWRAREMESMHVEFPIPKNMNLFDIQYLIETGYLSLTQETNTIALSLKGIMLVESTQVNAFGMANVAGILGFFESPDGSYTVSNKPTKLH